MNLVKTPKGDMIELSHISSIVEGWDMEYRIIKGWIFNSLCRHLTKGSFIVMEGGEEHFFKGMTPAMVCKWLSEQQIFHCEIKLDFFS